MTNHFWGALPPLALTKNLDQVVRIVAEQKNGYLIGHSDGSVNRALPPRAWKSRPRLELPVVGDWCLGTKETITELLPRRTLLYRPGPIDRPGPQPLAAEINQAWILTPAQQPFWIRVERYAHLCTQQNIPFSVIITKSDLASERIEAVKQEGEAKGWHCKVIGKDHSQLSPRDLLSSLGQGDTIVLLGPSGVGKSTLTNWLLGENTQSTAAVRESDGLGRHTTTERRLFKVAPQYFLIDSPGLRELRLPEEADTLPPCARPNCRHQTEPGCSVLAAFRSGLISKQELETKRKTRSH
jgi:ribosome biogenesis GTPase / thiamine phosphate phosphatase